MSITETVIEFRYWDATDGASVWLIADGDHRGMHGSDFGAWRLKDGLLPMLVSGRPIAQADAISKTGTGQAALIKVYCCLSLDWLTDNYPELSELWGELRKIARKAPATAPVDAVVIRDARLIESLREAIFDGKAGVWPDWVYEAANAVKHQSNAPWLPDLLDALGWHGGTVHQAIGCVRRLVAAERERERTKSA